MKFGIVQLFIFLLLNPIAVASDNFMWREGMSFLREDQVATKTGTTIVGICCRDGVVLGADTRSTGGSLIVDKDKLKMQQLAPRLFCCGAGTSADCSQAMRQTRTRLTKLRIERTLADDSMIIDPIASAVISLVDTINENRVQAVFILGGVDQSGPALFQISEDRTPQRLSFAALGSGAADALAVLETARTTWQNSEAEYGGNDYVEEVEIDVAIKAIRSAVRAGIVNDLGSGSHVDICVIRNEDIKQWRESLVSRWEVDRLHYCDEPFRNAGESSRGSDLGKKLVFALRQNEIFGMEPLSLDIELIE